MSDQPSTTKVMVASEGHHSPQALHPHSYPLLIKLFVLAVVATALYSAALLPKYVVAAKDLKTAGIAFAARDYTKALNCYRDVLRSVPSSTVACIGLAETVFSAGDREYDELALAVLSGIMLDEKDWARLTRVMPAEYNKYFEEEQK